MKIIESDDKHAFIFACIPTGDNEHKEIGLVFTRAKPKDAEEKKKLRERAEAGLKKNKINPEGLMREVAYDNC